jgi:hypothetical protein
MKSVEDEICYDHFVDWMEDHEIFHGMFPQFDLFQEDIEMQILKGLYELS